MIKNNKIQKVPLVSLILTNLLPVFGIIFLNWNALTILLVFGTESLIIGFFGIKKIRKKEEYLKNIKNYKKYLHSPVREFVLVYSVILLVHLVAIVGIFSLDNSLDSLKLTGSGISFFFLLYMSHSISYQFNFIGQKEYREKSLDSLIDGPFKRILPMQSALFVIVLLSEILFRNPPISAAFLVISIKIFFDINSHLKERQLK